MNSKICTVLITLTSLVGSSSALFAQSFQINWHTVDGGGGTSTGGAYQLSGTIGQPDAGRMNGGTFTLLGGFWSGTDVIQMPGAPALGIERLGGGGLRVFWPLPATDWVLDETDALAATSAATPWTPSLLPYQTNATHISVTLPVPVSNKVYRLRKL
jgi:hypothetical protein